MGNKVVMSVGVITTILLSEASSLLIRFLIRIYCEGKNVRKCIKLPTAAWSWVNVQPCNYGDGKNEIFLHCRKILYNVYSTTQREWAIKLCTLCIALLNDLPVADGFNYFKNYLVITPTKLSKWYDVNVNSKSELKQFFSHLKDSRFQVISVIQMLLISAIPIQVASEQLLLTHSIWVIILGWCTIMNIMSVLQSCCWDANISRKLFELIIKIRFF